MLVLKIMRNSAAKKGDHAWFKEKLKIIFKNKLFKIYVTYYCHVV